MKTLAVHIGTFGVARLESTALIGRAKNMLMTPQGAAGETVGLLGRRPGSGPTCSEQRDAGPARCQLTSWLSELSWPPVVIFCGPAPSPVPSLGLDAVGCHDVSADGAHQWEGFNHQGPRVLAYWP